MRFTEDGRAQFKEQWEQVVSVLLDLWWLVCSLLGLVGNAGMSFHVGDEHVIISDGYNWGRTDYVVLQTLPSSATTEERRKSNRLDFSGLASTTVTLPDGEEMLLRGSYKFVWFRKGGAVVRSIKINEHELGKAMHLEWKSADDLGEYLLRYTHD